MSARSINVDLLTSSYRIVGELSIGGSGVMGVLSDLTCSYLEIRHAKLARLHMATKLTASAQTIRVIKHQTVAICLARRDEVGPTSLARGAYARIFKYPLRMTTPLFDLEGTFEWGGRFDLSVIMDGTCEFVPLYDASLGAVLFPSLLIQGPVVLFNRSYLSTLVVENEGS